VANAPDKMAWICRIVAADIGRHVCGVHQIGRSRA